MDKLTEATYKEEEYTRGMMAYKAYFQSLEEVFDFSIADGFLDLGCNNGRLLEAITGKFPHVDIAGYDYFEWSKQYADKSVQNKIYITDLSKPYIFDKKYSFVNCTEVGEHIAKEAEDIFLDNVTKACDDVLLLTWSDEYDTEGQHLNPRSTAYIIERVESRGFTYWKETSEKFSDVLANKLEGIGYNWWAESMMVFKKNKFAVFNSKYYIQGTSTDNVNHKKFFNSDTLCKLPLQQYFMNLTDIIHTKVSSKKPFSILRLGDGDYYFLRRLSIGSAAVGKRAITIPYKHLNIEFFRKLFWQNDILASSLEKHYRRSWLKFILTEYIEKVILKLSKKDVSLMLTQRNAYLLDKMIAPLTIFGILPRVTAFLFSLRRRGLYLRKSSEIINNESVPLEAVYALVSTKWIFRNFRNNIGVIASDNKIKLIQELMKRNEYRNYLGLENFVSYISVPEKGAADNVLELSEKIGKEVKDSEAKIFLVGVGSSKLALLPLLKHHKDAVFIDVGAGIDAIAGIICQDRPYFAEWVNYRIKDYDYSKIDFMDQGNPSWNNENYKTITFK